VVHRQIAPKRINNYHVWLHSPLTKREKGTCSVKIFWCFNIVVLFIVHVDSYFCQKVVIRKMSPEHSFESSNDQSLRKIRKLRRHHNNTALVLCFSGQPPSFVVNIAIRRSLYWRSTQRWRRVLVDAIFSCHSVYEDYRWTKMTSYSLVFVFCSTCRHNMALWSSQLAILISPIAKLICYCGLKKIQRLTSCSKIIAKDKEHGRNKGTGWDRGPTSIG